MNSVSAFLLIGVTLQIATASSQITPSITSVSAKRIGKVGGTVDLECSVENAQDVPLVWTKVEEAGTIYISSGSALVVPDNRYSIRVNQTAGTYTLNIRNLQSEDAGLYRCVLNIAPDNRPQADVGVEVQPDNQNRRQAS